MMTKAPLCVRGDRFRVDLIKERVTHPDGNMDTVRYFQTIYKTVDGVTVTAVSAEEKKYVIPDAIRNNIPVGLAESIEREVDERMSEINCLRDMAARARANNGHDALKVMQECFETAINMIERGESVGANGIRPASLINALNHLRWERWWVDGFDSEAIWTIL